MVSFKACMRGSSALPNSYVVALRIWPQLNVIQNRSLLNTVHAMQETLSRLLIFGACNARNLMMW